MSPVQLESLILAPAERRTLRNLLAEKLPSRLVDGLCHYSGIQTSQRCNQLTKKQRRKLLSSIFNMVLPVLGDRGFRYAEVTAGGVPLNEIDLKTMRSRQCPDLYLCGEVCDVDGRIGGFNFQWAWASGYICGVSAALAVDEKQAFES